MADTQKELLEKIAHEIDRLKGHYDALDLIKDRLDGVEGQIKELSRILVDPRSGFALRIDRLEVEAERRKWVSRSTFAATIGLIGALIASWFKHH